MLAEAITRCGGARSQAYGLLLRPRRRPTAMSDFRMPSLGADMAHGTVLEWRVAPGDQVERGQVVAVVDTEKAAIEVEIFESGVIEELLVEPGSRVPVGTVLARVRAGEAAHVAGEEALQPTEAAEEAAGDAATAEAPEEKEEKEEKITAERAPAEPGAPPSPPPSRPRASPAARALAAERGIDLAGLQGSGPDGVIVRADVEAAAAPAGAPIAPPRDAGPERHAAPAGPLIVTPVAGRAAAALGIDLSGVQGTGPDGAITREDVEMAAGISHPPLPPSVPAAPEPAPSEGRDRSPDRQRAMREAIAAAVSRSKREIPHYYLSTRIDMTRALAWLEAENRERSMAERILPAALLLRATALALGDYPELNGFWEGDGFRPGEAVHLGVVIFLREGGIVAPAILDAGGMEVGTLMRALTDLVQRARSGGLRGSELTSATITVTNLGDRGVESVFGVIYPPQVAIVGFGRIAEEPWAEGGLLGARPVITATLAADHRASDGHRGGLMLSAIDRLLQTPEAL